MGPCTANARRPAVGSRYRGTTISCCVADLSRGKTENPNRGGVTFNLSL